LRRSLQFAPPHLRNLLVRILRRRGGAPSMPLPPVPSSVLRRSLQFAPPHLRNLLVRILRRRGYGREGGGIRSTPSRRVAGSQIPMGIRSPLGGRCFYYPQVSVPHTYSRPSGPWA